MTTFHADTRMYNGTRQFFDLAQKDVWMIDVWADFKVGIVGLKNLHHT